MPSKYDTNPLDPDFPEKVRAESEGQPTRVLSEEGAPGTQNIGRPVRTEDPTIRLSPGSAQAGTSHAYAPPPFEQPYTGQYVPGAYQPQGFAAPPSERKVEPFGMSENVLTAVSYVPWYIGLIAAAIILFLAPRSETKIRFHAAQGLAAHLGVLIIAQLLFAVGGFASAIGVIFTVITSIMFIVWAIKAWRGKPVHIQSIEGLTNWLEDKIRQKDR
jgi:uncharacterized membrane protein